MLITIRFGVIVCGTKRGFIVGYTIRVFLGMSKLIISQLPFTISQSESVNA